MTRRSRMFGPILLGVLGVVFGGVGAFLALTDGPRRAAARAAALPLVSAAMLADSPLGREVLVEGRIAESTLPAYRDFVAWRREEFTGVESSGASKGREIWRHVETVAPPLRIVTGSAEVGIVNRGYELRAPVHHWRESTSGSGGFFSRRPEGATGFRIGDTVVVDARVVAEPGAEGALPTRALEATVLSGGTHAAYLETLREGIFVARLVGGIFTGAGVLLLVLATWLFRRANPNDESAPAQQVGSGSRRHGRRGGVPHHP